MTAAPTTFARTPCRGNSAIRQFGNSAIRQFGNSAIRQFGNYTGLLLSLIITASVNAYSGTIVVTPGSLAGYTYFPPPTSPITGGSTTENTSTFQRCYWAANNGDLSVDLSTKNWYGLDKTTIYYKIIGGNGGNGTNGGGGGGGGGGSSAIIQNNNPIAIAKGGNGGGGTPVEINGKFTASKNDKLRFITGGAGGDGSGFGIGGGGGAGYRGGGAGASAIAASFKSTSTSENGEGGGINPGAGGYHNTSNLSAGTAYSGTSGSGESGGVAGYPSTASKGTIGLSGEGAYGNYSNGYMGYSAYTSNHPATGKTIGSLQGPYDTANPSTYAWETSWFGGGGGRFGSGALPQIAKPMDYQNLVSWTPGSITLQGPRYAGDPSTVDTKWRLRITDVSEMPQPTEFVMSRPIPNDSSCLPIGYAGAFCTNRSTSLPGRVILMYQAETCQLF